MSVVEIYCERIRDLLDPSRDNCAVKESPARGIYIEGSCMRPNLNLKVPDPLLDHQGLLRSLWQASRSS